MISIKEVLGGTWIPAEEVPCSSDPDAWADSVVYQYNHELKQMALKTCRVSCSLRAECLESAMKVETGFKHDTRFGIRGGLLPKQRAALAKERAKSG